MENSLDCSGLINSLIEFLLAKKLKILQKISAQFWMNMLKKKIWILIMY